MVMLVILLCVDRMVGMAFGYMKDIGLKRNAENMWLKTPYTVESVKTGAVVIGSSKATHNYIPDSLAQRLRMSVYNCGQDGCFFLYQDCIVNMILDRYSPKIILWDIQPGSFTKSNAADEYQNIRYLTPYYRSSKWAKKYIDSESKKMPVRMLSDMYGYNSKFLNYVFPLLTHTSATQNGYIPLASTGYAYPNFGKKQQVYGEKVSQKYLSILDETLKRCRKANIDIRLYISPTYYVKNNLTHQAELAIMHVAEKNRVILYNYHSASEFMCDSTLFKDNEHLNENGARRFVEYIK